MAQSSGMLPGMKKSGTESLEEIHSRMDALVRVLEHHNWLYHTMSAPEISDEEYDQLFAELVKLEKEYPAFKSPHSPTLRVGPCCPALSAAVTRSVCTASRTSSARKSGMAL